MKDYPKRTIYLNGRLWTVVSSARRRYVWCDPIAGRDYKPVITAGQVTYGYRFDVYGL